MMTRSWVVIRQSTGLDAPASKIIGFNNIRVGIMINDSMQMFPLVSSPKFEKAHSLLIEF
jgi:hypothetical protein